LSFGKNAQADPPVNSFAVDEFIYVNAAVANATGKHNLNFLVTALDVVNKAPGDHVMNKSVDFEGNAPLFFNFSIAYPGQYKIEAVLTDATGKQIDAKSGDITVTGEAAPPKGEEHEREVDGDREREKDREKGRGKDRPQEREKDRDKDKDRK
jgi:hypothetical protein